LFPAVPIKTLALIGKSGVGKTTVAHLMVRFFDPDQGHIKIDNIDLRDMSLNYLRQNIGLVSQDNYLFDTSITDNLRYGLPSATIKQMRQACKAANALEFIDKLPKKLDTVIGERGIKLSSGQKQRLSIARTVLKNPKILILDEATSSLDSHSEKLVQDALWKLIKGRTAIIIAHRLSTIQKADQIRDFHSLPHFLHRISPCHVGRRAERRNSRDHRGGGYGEGDDEGGHRSAPFPARSARSPSQSQSSSTNYEENQPAANEPLALEQRCAR